MEYFLLYDTETKAVQITNYEPSVPNSIVVKKLSQDEYRWLEVDQTHYFDTASSRIKIKLPSTLESQNKEREIQARNTENQNFLSSTDWKILRHLREQALGLTTSMTNEEYIELEKRRHTAASSIIK